MTTTETPLQEAERLLRRYVDDVCEIVEIFDAMDPSGARVSGEYGETVFASGQVNDTERPPPMFSRDEIDTLDPVVKTLGDADELLRGEVG